MLRQLLLLRGAAAVASRTMPRGSLAAPLSARGYSSDKKQDWAQQETRAEHESKGLAAVRGVGAHKEDEDEDEDEDASDGYVYSDEYVTSSDDEQGLTSDSEEEWERRRRREGVTPLRDYLTDVPPPTLEERLGKFSFKPDVMRARLQRALLREPSERYANAEAVEAEFEASIAESRPMEKAAANILARALQDWALARGATNFAHWASPIRGPVNLLKHDLFVDLNFGGDMEPAVKFSGTKLFFNETDGSSFPNGGLRETHTAAAFLTWDKRSRPFVRGDTLYLPSAFVSWNGDALDEKTPLLRSQEAVWRAGQRLLPLLGVDAEGAGVDCNVGWEQEFFLVTREDFLRRPDLVACGRTLLGAQPPRGQQTDQNYFARVPAKAKQVLDAAVARLHAVGSSLSVYHSEVAPAQFEFSPIFSLVNSAADGNVCAMEVLQEAANEHGMVALFHEKPFANLNGSGKHSNWGLNVSGTGRNLFVPGKNEAEQRSFLAMVACMLRAVHVHGDLLRTAVASAGNDHRLGAQEAPPAIMSLYLGQFLGEHCEKIARGESKLEGYNLGAKSIAFGSANVQPVNGGAEDRNRTAPFPFCGNRFEFRAVGSEQHIGWPLACVQTAVAESMEVLADRVEKNGESLEDAVRAMLKEHLPAMFNGDGYSSEWQEVDAPKRGLPNLRTTPDALATLDSDKNRALFEKTKVLNAGELTARAHIALEKYVSTILIEASCLQRLVDTHVLPACAQDLQRYSGGAAALSGPRGPLYEALQGATAELTAALDSFPHQAELQAQAEHARDVIKPLMSKIRVEADQAETLVSADLWPLPSYQKLLLDTVVG